MSDPRTLGYPVLSSAEVSQFLLWDNIENNGIINGYLANPGIDESGGGIVTLWQGRQILTWVDAQGNGHFLDVSSNPGLIQQVMNPTYTPPPNNPPAGACDLFSLDGLQNCLKDAEFIILLAVGIWVYSKVKR